MTALYLNQSIREIEQRIIQDDQETAYQLMMTAGQAAFSLLRERWPKVKRLSICCGKGKNGGDGYAIARLAKEQGLAVQLITLTELDELKGIAKRSAEACLKAGILIEPLQKKPVFQGQLIIDAILGSGLSDNVREPFVQFIEAINESKLPVLSIDTPSGLNVDTGQAMGIAVKADATITFIAEKPGLFTGAGPAHCGELICNDLDIPLDVFQSVTPSAELLQWQNMRSLLPRRQRDAHKGHYGHTLIIGGDYGMGGAVRMSSEGAMRAGSGLVTVATRPEHVAVVNCSRPEIMCHKVTSGGDLDVLLARATVIVLGPGLGTSEWSISLFNRILETDQPKLLDADALNLLSESRVKNDNWILTPHPGEAARLLGCKTKDVQENRFEAAADIHKRYGGVVVLKGAGTIVYAGEKEMTTICPAGNPGMASGGMGDVLSGVIGGLMAQGLELKTAAQLGVLVHAIAADRAAEEGGERGLLATDLMPHIRDMVNPDAAE